MKLGYFAYGTLQKGFPNWPALADRLGDPRGRFRTVEPHALAVPIQPGCPNPGCGLLHRMAALVPGVDGCHVDGDLFVIDHAVLDAIDQLEGYDGEGGTPGPYVRVEVEVAAIAGGEIRLASTYRARDPGPWRELVAGGRAELMTCYDPRLAEVTPKRCCITQPNHAGRHDVIDPFGR